VLDRLNDSEDSQTDVYRVAGYDERICALKVNNVAVSQDPDFAADMKDVAEVANSLSHENIAPIYDFFISDNKVCLVREFGDSTLEDFLSDSNDRFSLTTLLEMFVRACDGVSYLHDNGIIHRGLKPQNILVTGNGAVKVADFGLSGIISEESFSDVSNKFSYMSPEQLQARKILIGREPSSDALPLTLQTDVYSLGLLLYEMLSRTVLFPEENLEKAHESRGKTSLHTLGGSQGIPEELAGVLGKALAVNPSLRYSSVAEMSVDIERFLVGYWESYSKAGLLWYKTSYKYPFIAQIAYFLRHLFNGFSILIGSFLAAFLVLVLPSVLILMFLRIDFFDSVNGRLVIATALASLFISLSITFSLVISGTRFKQRLPGELIRLRYLVSTVGVIVLVYAISMVFMVDSHLSLKINESNDSDYIPPTNLIGSVISNVATPIPKHSWLSMTPVVALPVIINETPTPSPTNTPSPTPKFNPTFTPTPSNDKRKLVNHALTRVPTPPITPTATLTPTATNTPTPTPTSTQTPTPTQTPTLTPLPVQSDPFTMQSTREEVILAQGYCPNYEPTDNYPAGHRGFYGVFDICPEIFNKGHYYFGKSKVVFRKPFDWNSNTVSFWIDDGDLNLKDHVLDGNSIDIGSTRLSVFQANGPSDNIQGASGDKWEYGENSVTFEYSHSVGEMVVTDYTNYDCALKIVNNQCFSGSEPIVSSGYPSNSTNIQSSWTGMVEEPPGIWKTFIYESTEIFWVKDIPWSLEGKNISSIDLVDIKNKKKVSSFNPIIDSSGTITRQPIYIPQGGYYFQVNIPDGFSNNSWDIKIRKEFDIHDGEAAFFLEDGGLEKFTPIFSFPLTEISVSSLRTNYIALYEGETGEVVKEIQKYNAAAINYPGITFNVPSGKYYFHVIGNKGWYLSIY